MKLQEALDWKGFNASWGFICPSQATTDNHFLQFYVKDWVKKVIATAAMLVISTNQRHSCLWWWCPYILKLCKDGFHKDWRLLFRMVPTTWWAAANNSDLSWDTHKQKHWNEKTLRSCAWRHTRCHCNKKMDQASVTNSAASAQIPHLLVADSRVPDWIYFCQHMYACTLNRTISWKI